LDTRGDYTALGPVVNLASRLCDEAQSGEILIDQRTYGATRTLSGDAAVRKLSLKGYTDPVTARVVAHASASIQSSAATARSHATR
ncbi:MAG: hypothetical protein JOZ75_07640, partial [Candidatus Dormibacteraeota bacterium]|nr:hypothetical protein [Candidatus Dormibacteraeota bacterium]